MKKRGYFVLLLSLFVLLSGCGKKSDKDKTPPEIQKDVGAKLKRPLISKEDTHKPVSFYIQDIANRKTILTFNGLNGSFERIHQPIVIITFISESCSPCRGMLPYINRLQLKYYKDIFVIGVLVKSDRDINRVSKFMKHYSSKFFISIHKDNDRLANYLVKQLHIARDYPIPLTLIFKNGRYIMDIKGAIPYEMLEQLIKQIKKS